MSLAAPHCTSIMITLQKANIEFRLQQITLALQSLSRAAAQESQQYYNQGKSTLAMSLGEDDESKVALDLMNSMNFSAAMDNMRMQYKVKEDVLNTEKLQLESQHKALTQQEEWVDKMVDSGIKDLKYFQ